MPREDMITKGRTKVEEEAHLHSLQSFVCGPMFLNNETQRCQFLFKIRNNNEKQMKRIVSQEHKMCEDMRKTYIFQIFPFLQQQILLLL